MTNPRHLPHLDGADASLPNRHAAGWLPRSHKTDFRALPEWLQSEALDRDDLDELLADWNTARARLLPRTALFTLGVLLGIAIMATLDLIGATNA